MTYVSFGDGAPWVGNYVDGTVSRVDPGTKTKSPPQTAVGTPQALAVGEGAAWVSVAGGTIAGKLPSPPCGDGRRRAGRRPTSWSRPISHFTGPGAEPAPWDRSAIRSVVEQSGFKAGDYSIGYQSCDVSTAGDGGFEFRKCASNANAYAHAEQLVAVVGTFSSFCAEVEIPILNRAPDGPLAMISPSNTGPGLTQGPADRGGPRRRPDIYYPTGVRNYARSIPREDVQAPRTPYSPKIWASRPFTSYPRVVGTGKNPHARPFERAAQRLGVTLAGSSDFVSGTENADEIANAVAQSGADGVFLAAGWEKAPSACCSRCGPALETPRRHDDRRVRARSLDLLDTVGRDAHGVYISTTDFPSASRY